MLFASTIAIAAAMPAHAQDSAGQDSADQTVTEAPERGGLSEIVVTATKRGAAQNVQDVPFAVTAFGTQQLEEKHFQTLQSLSFEMPNVQMEQIGTTPGYANFSIRGLGVNSSIPSIDPTVGVFVDGVYMGISAGVVFDNFDIEGIEVLRGPQGILFGRNVTGGAVIVRTTKPSETFRADFRAKLTSGPMYTASGMVTGPLIDDVLQGKLAVYYNKDEGYFKNQYDGSDIGKNRTVIVRPAFRLSPGDIGEMIVRLEYGEYDGDGAVPTNHGLYPRDSFKVNIDEPGYAHNDWKSASVENNIDVGFGNGTITNLMAYREYNSEVRNDIDASPDFRFHSGNTTHQKQMSEELRYAGTFGDLDVTTGLYFFTQKIDYIEGRELAGGTVALAGSGKQDQETYGAFAAFDWHFTDQLTLNLGARYSAEYKKVDIATLSAACDYSTGSCDADFHDDNWWKGFTPRIGLQWQPDSATQLYAFWAKGFRSGGYNFRNALASVDPGPFGDETQNSYEIGIKKDVGNFLRVNASAFWNEIGDVQREIQTPILGVGTAQIITNSADARVRGAEGEITLSPGGGFTISGQVGYTEGKYTDVFYDLNRDGVIDDVDYALQLPRLSPWTYGASLAWSGGFGDVDVDARVSANHRDANWYNDQNTGLLAAADMVDANLSFTKGAYTLSVFGTNLLDEATFGTEAPLPFFAGSTFSPLNKGRVFGVELAAKY